jgi:hypothetical protein
VPTNRKRWIVLGCFQKNFVNSQALEFIDWERFNSI